MSATAASADFNLISDAYRDDGLLVILDNNPQRSMGHRFHSFALQGPPHLESGDPFVAVLYGDQPLVRNYFWRHEDYLAMLSEAGFVVEAVVEPTAPAGDRHWVEESRFPPNVLFVARRRPRPAE